MKPFTKSRYEMNVRPQTVHQSKLNAKMFATVALSIPPSTQLMKNWKQRLNTFVHCFERKYMVNSLTGLTRVRCPSHLDHNSGISSARKKSHGQFCGPMPSKEYIEDRLVILSQSARVTFPLGETDV